MEDAVMVGRHPTTNHNQPVTEETASEDLLFLGEPVTDPNILKDYKPPTGSMVARCVFITGSSKTFNCPNNKAGTEDQHHCLQILVPGSGAGSSFTLQPVGEVTCQ
jgi:hypothetical protein